MMASIKKLVVAVVGMALMVVNTKWGVDLTGMDTALVNAILAALTALGVYQVENKMKDA